MLTFWVVLNPKHLPSFENYFTRVIMHVISISIEF